MGFISDGALKFLEAIIKQATINCSTNTDEQALEVQALYQNWEDYPDGYEFKADRACFNTYAKHILEMMLENY